MASTGLFSASARKILEKYKGRAMHQYCYDVSANYTKQMRKGKKKGAIKKRKTTWARSGKKMLASAYYRTAAIALIEKSKNQSMSPGAACGKYNCNCNWH